MANEQFDVTIIGSGPGGYVAAIRAAQLGLKVAIVEKDKRLGGTCTLRGCIPTKQLLMSAHVYEQMQHAADFGVEATGIQLAFANVQKRKDKVVTKNSKGIEYLMKKNKITAFCSALLKDGHYNHLRRSRPITALVEWGSNLRDEVLEIRRATKPHEKTLNV